MQRYLLSSVLAFVAVMVFSSATPALAHDSALPASSSGDSQRDKDARTEATILTEELRAASRPTKLPAIQAAYADKAERRRTLLSTLADSNPAAVLDLALTTAERDALPPHVRSSIEQRVTVDGELQVYHVDFEDGHSAYQSKLVKGGQETPVKLGAPIGQAQPGDVVRSSGVALAGESTVVTDQMVVVQSPTSVGPTGPQRTAIILVMAPNVSSHPYANKVNTANLFFYDDNNPSTSEKSARAFYLEASYGQTSIVGGNGGIGGAGDVFGPFPIATSSCGSSEIRNAAVAASDGEVNFSTYDRVVFSIANSACGNGGIGTIRTQGVSTGEGTQRLSMSWNFGNALGETTALGKIGGVALHEYGHNLGVWHANSLECGNVAIGSGTCTSDEYGDPSDVMGSSGGFGHPNGVHKDILGWVSSRQQVASTPGSYTIYPYENLSVNTKVLKIPRTRDANGNVNGYYYLEYRKPTAYWNTFSTNRPEYGNGVLVHTAGTTPLCTAVCSPDFSGDGGGGDSNIIDTLPGSQAGTNDFRDAPLLVNESYVDVGAGVTIQVTATNADSAVVAVSYTEPKRSIHTVVYPEQAGSVSGAGVFNMGQTATLSAAPSGCFAYWRENRSQQSYPNPYTFTVQADRTLEAVFTSTTCAQTPANDNFAGPTVGIGQQNVVTTSATIQTGEPTTFTCDGTQITVGRTAWYSIQPASTAQYTLTTAGSSYDTVLAVYTGGAVNSLTPVACDDDANGGQQSQVQFTAQAGTTYRVQLSGYNAAGGNGVLNVSATAVESDPRQEGSMQVTGGLTVGSSATISVAVKNYGQVATPSLRPVVDGTNPAGQNWRAESAQPSSATIQPGQTVTFTLQQPLGSPGSWTTTGVSLVDGSTGAAWKALPANGQSQQVLFTASMNCGSPRPKVTMQTALSGDGRLAVTLTAGAQDTGNRLTGLQFGTDAKTPITNAVIDLPGVGDNRTAAATVSIPGAPGTYTFYLRRQAPNQPVTLPLIVTDYCGTWQTMVGAGTNAGF